VEEYTFTIQESYTPTTLPMERMAQYVLQIAKMLGHKETIHFKEIATGSVELKYFVEHEAAPKVEQRLEELRRNAAPEDAKDAFRQINEMLRDDNAIGLHFRSSANDPLHDPSILRFPGKEIPRPVKVGPLAKYSIIVGELTRIGGKSPKAQIETQEGRVWHCDLTKSIARDLAPHLYQVLRIEGDAKWERIESGIWEPKSLNVKSFSVLPEHSLTEAINELRNIEGGEWGTTDPAEAARKRHEDEELH